MPALHIPDSNKSITANIGAGHTLAFLQSNGDTVRVALSNEDGVYQAIKESANWVYSGDEPVWVGDSLQYAGPVELDGRITVTANSVTITGAFSAIDSMIITSSAGVVKTLDYTTGSIASAEADTGVTLSLSGFSSEAEAFGASSALLDILETKHFTLVKDAAVQAFAGRSNREIFKFHMKENDNRIVTDTGNHIDFSQEGIDRVEIFIDGGGSIDSDSGSIKINGAELLVRLGDLNVPTGSIMTLTYVLYVTGDSNGLVLTASETLPSTTASMFRATPSLAMQ